MMDGRKNIKVQIIVWPDNKCEILRHLIVFNKRVYRLLNKSHVFEVNITWTYFRKKL